MSTQAVTSGAPKNNGGTVKKAGNTNTTTGPITVARTLADDAMRSQYGYTVVEAVSEASSGHLGTFSAFANFNHQNTQGEYIMKKYTHYVNGSANTILSSCAGDFGVRRSIPGLETNRMLGSGYLTSWDYETGAITKGANAGQVADFGTDDAAHPTNAVPGELAYKTGAKIPVQDDYKPRTG